LAAANANKKYYEDLVADLSAKLAVLQEKLDAVIKEKEDAEATAERCERKLGYATRLVNALGAEGERW
jgi:exonuclease VII small subunit